MFSGASRPEWLDPPVEMLAETGDQAMSKFVSRFMNDESGATAIEYGLIVALIAVVIIVAVSTLGNSLSGNFNSINAKL
jgi:pilus assembly protein Flp/PilA